MPDHNILKCRFCDYQVLKFRVVNMRTQQGWVSLKHHIEINHPEQAEQIYGPERDR